MTAIIVFLIMVLICLAASRLFYVKGVKNGYEEGKNDNQDYWNKLKDKPLAGHEVDVPHFGPVMILGYGTLIDGRESVDVISMSALNGKAFTDLTEDEQLRHTICHPLDEFMAHAEISVKYLK